MDLKYPDGRPIWRKVVLTLACTLCTARGKSSSCKHMAEKRPAWQDDENQMRTTAMMQGDTVAVDTEILNIERMDGILPLFRKEDLDKFHERPAFLGSSFTFDHVVVAIDPAAGGLSSEYAITSIGCNKYTKDRVLHKHVSIIGSDTSNSNDPEVLLNTIKQHIIKIRGLKTVRRNTSIIIVPENNLGNEAAHIKNYLQKNVMHTGPLQFYIHTTKDVDVQPGFRTTYTSKLEMIEYLKTIVDSHRITYWPEFIQVNNNQYIDNREKIYEQATNFQKEIIPSKRAGISAKIKYSGKQKGMDDLVITLAIAVYIMKDYLK